MAQSGHTGEKALWDRAQRHLVRYGDFFQPLIIAKAQRSFMTTTDGRRLLDFASGQTYPAPGRVPGCLSKY